MNLVLISMSAGVVTVQPDAGTANDNGHASQASTNNPAIVVSSSSCISKQKIKAVEAKLHKCMDREDSRVKSVRALLPCTCRLMHDRDRYPDQGSTCSKIF